MRSFFIFSPLLVEARRMAYRKTKYAPFPAMKSRLDKPARRIPWWIRRAEDADETGR